MAGLQALPLSVEKCTYLCPLSTNSKFCLSRLRIQRNWNATDVDAMTSEDVKSFSQSYIMTQVVKQAMVTPSGEGIRAARTVEDSCVNKHVGFAAICTPAARIRSKSLMPRKTAAPDCGLSGAAATSPALQGKAGVAAHTRCSLSSVRLALDDSSRDSNTVTSLLVPLNHSNQSNLHLLIDESANNDQTSQETSNGATTKEKGSNACDVGPAGASRDQRELLQGSGIPYWNVYEYRDFRQLQYGQSHVFDPMMDPNLHRESIILDCYNRLRTSYPRFRMPLSMYHVR